MPAKPAPKPLQKYREKNQVAVVWDGIDSDGMRFQGEVHYILASSRAYAEHQRRMRERDPKAELRHKLCRPSVASRITAVTELA